MIGPFGTPSQAKFAKLMTRKFRNDQSLNEFLLKAFDYLKELDYLEQLLPEEEKSE